MPPEMQRYKQIVPYAAALLAWLETMGFRARSEPH